MGPIAFLKTRAARRWVPLIVSVLVHAGLIVGVIYGFRQYQANSAAVILTRANVPDALLVEGAAVGRMSSTPISEALPAAPAPTLISPMVTSPAQTAHSGPPALPSALSMNSGSGSSRPMLGLPSASGPAGSVGIRISSAGPKAQFMGISGDAIRVVFVCDASGSMMDRLPILENQLRTSIDQLQPIQWFNVIFFQDSKAVAANSNGLIQALPGARPRIENMLQGIQAHGSSNPLAAINLAFSQHPQIIYLLTDGDFEDVADSVTDAHIVDEIHRLNADQQTHVNTILFISSQADLQQQDAKGGQAVLQRIAANNDGTFKVVVAEPQ